MSGWEKRWSRLKRGLAAAVIGAAMLSPPAFAHETDQHTVPEGRQFADVGSLISRWHYHAIKHGVDTVNAEIKAAIDAHDSSARIRELQDPDRLVRAVNRSFPSRTSSTAGTTPCARKRSPTGSPAVSAPTSSQSPTSTSTRTRSSTRGSSSASGWGRRWSPTATTSAPTRSATSPMRG